MRLTRQEIILLGAVALALVVGECVKRYRTAHPVGMATPGPRAKK